MTRPARFVGDTVDGQLPAPPADSAKLSAIVDDVPIALQREEPASARANTVVTVARIVADWVMEPEVADPANDEFLKWPTRCAFVDDLLQVRIQVEGHALALASWVEIEIKVGATVLTTLTTSNPAPAGQLQRPLQAAASLGTMLETQTDAAIHLEADAGAPRSLLASTVKLPDWPDSNTAADGSATYQASVRIASGHVTYTADLPPLRVLRWWAAPRRNIDAVRAPATTITPKIDGEEFFAQAAVLIGAAAAGHKIFLASWSFFCLTNYIGGANGAATMAANPVVLANNLRNTIIWALCGAAGRGAQVCILLDHHNSFWAEDAAEHVLAHVPPATRNNITIRRADHPTKIKLGIGPFSAGEKQNGSYHEKYLCLTGNGAWQALIGGIDFEPDRNSPFQHGWKQDAAQYDAGLARFNTRFGEDWSGGRGAFGSEFILWHDIGVYIEGQEAVQFLADDFTRRWNAGVAGARPAVNLPLVPYVVPPTAAARVQFVKSELLAAAPVNARAVPAGTYGGTRDAWECAVREARHYIYIENQYLRDPAFRNAIIARLQQNTRLQVLIVVPFEAEETMGVVADPTYNSTTFAGAAVDFLFGDAARRQAIEEELKNGMAFHGDWLQAQFITQLRAQGGARVGIYSLARMLPPFAPNSAQMIYPHSKIMIVDDTWAYIGSANANGRSLNRDAESGYVIHDRATVTAFRRRLWNEHVGVAWPTREIRTFLTKFNALAPGPHPQLANYGAAELAGVQAVKLGVPRPGVQYNGPAAYLREADDDV